MLMHVALLLLGPSSQAPLARIIVMQLEMQLGIDAQRALTLKSDVTYHTSSYASTCSTLSLPCPCHALCQVYMGLEAKLGVEAAGDISLEVSSPGGQCIS